MTPEIVAVLDEDPDLAAGLEGTRLATATRDLRAAAFNVPGGRWDPDGHAPSLQGGIGLLVLDGVLARRVGTQRRSGAELLGPGDLLKPASADGSFDVTVHQVVKDLEGTVLADAEVHHVYRFDGPLIAGMELGPED